ncbi:crosslink repair DNA glycosylase YcaQ family protein [soil metagenome]
MPSAPLSLSLAEARALSLRAQGLAEASAPFGLGPAGTLAALQHLGYVQVDTINVIQRAHHHVLWSRVPDYRPEYLHTLQAEASAFEYWNHAASYLPTSDYRYSLPLMRHYRTEFQWCEDTPELRASMRRMLRLIRTHGPLRLSDIESEGKSASWTDEGMGKIERRALRQLWMRGDLMIRSRHGMQKVFDLTDNVLPPGTNRKFPTPRETADFHVRRALRALGVARLPELHYLRDASHASGVRAALARLLKTKEVTALHIEGTTAYALSSSLELTAPIESTPARILSPFDNLTIQRKRLKWLFHFDYVTEIYVPAPKRKFGYFTLPVLWRDQLIARMDAKADRPHRNLIIHRLDFESSFRDFKEALPALQECLASFSRFQECDTYTLTRVEPRSASRALSPRPPVA